MGSAAYDDIAEWYDTLIRTGGLIHDLILPSVYALMGKVQGRRVCDLACGQGVVSRYLAQQGAKVVGIDISRKLLELARHDPESQNITFVQGDAQALAVRDAAFDGVVCNMALMDIPDLKAVALAVARILKPQRWFVVSITHPCLETIKGQTRWSAGQAVTSYFAEGVWRSDNPDGVRGKVDAHHRTLSTYLNTLLEAGLTLERLIEPHADESANYGDIPTVLVARFRKRAN